MKTGTITQSGLITLGALTLAACGGGQTDSTDSSTTLLLPPADNAPQIVAAPDREPRVVGVSTYGGSEGGGGGTSPETPQAGINVSCDGLNCTMTASDFGSGDYYWDFGDGNGDEGRSVSHQFNVAGNYTVYFGHVSAGGEYQEQSKEIVVTDSGNTGNPVSTEIPQFKGRLQGWGDQLDLPRDGGSIKLTAGTLSATLTVPKKRRFALYVDRYDTATGDWVEITQVRSKRGTAVIEMPIDAGEYGFTVMSLGRGGRYTLNASVN